MNDAIFVARLHSQKLITGDINDKVGSGSNLTRAEAATYFLNNVIKPAISTGYNEPFRILLLQMESFGNNLKDLAEKMKNEIQMLINNSVTGKNRCTDSICMYICIHIYTHADTCRHMQTYTHTNTHTHKSNL